MADYPRYKGIVEIISDHLPLDSDLRLKPGIEVCGIMPAAAWSFGLDNPKTTHVLKVYSYLPDVGLPFVEEAAVIPRVPLSAIQRSLS